MGDETKPMFTPGPWSVGDTGTRGDGIWIQPADLNANVICDLVGRLNVPEEDTTQITDEDVANAHLIAAAPTMLDALNNVRGFLRKLGYTSSTVDAAINKATNNP